MNVFVFLIRAHYAFLNACLTFFKRILYTRIKTTATKILIVRKGNLGDIVCSYPAFESIKKHFHNASFDLLTTHGTLSSIGANAVISDGYFNDVFEYRAYTRQELFAFIRKKSYDVVVELPADVDTFWNQLRNLVFFRLAGIQTGGGWSVTRTQFLANYQLKYIEFENEQLRLKRILERCSIQAMREQLPPLFTQYDLANIKSKYEFDTKRPMVAIAVGAKLEKKKWPLSYFKTVIEYLQAKQFTVIAIGDEADYGAIESLAIPSIINTCGKLTIAESAALLSICAFTICNDSGPMHLSYSVGTPVYAIISARNYKGKWNPPNDGQNRVFSNYNVPCAGCMNNPCNNNICMQQITPEQIIQSLNCTLR